MLKKNAPIAFQKMPTVKKVKLIALRKSILKFLINKKVTSKPVPEDTDPFRIPIRKTGIMKLNFKFNLILLSWESRPKLGFLREYIAKIIEKIPSIKYRYCSERNLTIIVPKKTPGVPNTIICHKTSISFLRDLIFLNDPPKPKATVATLWVARAW